jgi:hypothetical protein
MAGYPLCEHVSSSRIGRGELELQVGGRG